MHEIGPAAWKTVRVIVPCSSCGHALWSEAKGAGARRIVFFFDDDRRSSTYAEQVWRCPTCGTDPDGEAPTPFAEVRP